MRKPLHLNYAAPANPRRHSIFAMIALSFGMSFLFAATWTTLMTLNLPKTDGAYGETPFSDPLVLPVMSLGACIATVLVAPRFYFACRSLPLAKSVAIIITVTMLELVVVTPISAAVGLIGSFISFCAGVVLARTFLRPLRPVTPDAAQSGTLDGHNDR